MNTVFIHLFFTGHANAGYLLSTHAKLQTKKFSVTMQKAQHISSRHKQSNERCEGACAGINPAVIESTSARVSFGC